MTCSQITNRLSRYLDGELSRWSHWKVEIHLRYCPKCAAVMRELAEVDGALLQSARETPAPAYLTDAVMHRLPAMPPGRSLRRGSLPWMAGLAVAGAQAVALFGAYWWGFLHGSEGNHPDPAAGASVSVPFLPPVGRPAALSASHEDGVPAASVLRRLPAAGHFLGRQRPYGEPDPGLVADIEGRPVLRIRQGGTLTQPVLEGAP
jgi:anti-sigma factor RsiW